MAIRSAGEGYEAVLKLNIGGIRHEQKAVRISGDSVKIVISADAVGYKFSVRDGESESCLGYGQSKFLSSETCGGFTGVMLGLYAVGNQNTVEFSDLCLKYTEEDKDDEV